MDEDVESRIIVKMNNKWKKKAGPFRDVDLSNLQAKNWTLLVQEVDRHVPHIADLWAKHFNFIPTWRRDDVMVSYAREGGGIGAHVDNYDVFLVQGRGTRRWSIENSFLTDADELEREVPDVQTRLLTGFRCDQSWVLEPGDTLYLPPRVPHQGVSLDDNCITVSMGFRAPSYISLCSAYVEHVCSRLERSDMYQDPDLELQASVGAVASEAIESVLTSLQSKLMAGFEDADCWTDWLGKYLTLPLRNKPLPRPFFLAEDKDLEDDQDDDEDPDPLYIRSREHSVASKRTFADVDEVIAEARAGRMTLRRAEGCRAVSIGSSLFIDGESFFCVPPADSAGLLQGLCDSNQVNHDALLTMLRSSESTELLRELLQRGYLYPVDLTY
jgi:ribosomal protein L16 Arg81 hydroxylase